MLSSISNRPTNNTTRRHPPLDGEDPRSNIFQKAKTRSLRISIIIVTAFVICWAPYYFMMMTFIFLQPDQQVLIYSYNNVVSRSNFKNTN